MLGPLPARLCALLFACLVLLPGRADAFGVQRFFTTPGIQCCGETVVYNGLAYEGDDLWATAGPNNQLFRYTTAGALIQAIPAGNGTQGLTVDQAHHVAYVIQGGYHGAKSIHMYSTVDGTEIGTGYGGSEFPGDFAEGISVAVNEATGETYATGNISNGKIVHFAANGTIARRLFIGNHPADIEVDQATGDVLVAEADSDIVTRYDSQLDNRRVLVTGSGDNHTPVGISLAPDGALWVGWGSNGVVGRYAPNGTLLASAATANGLHDVEADAHGGAWISFGNTNVYRYVATDPPVASFTANPGGDVPTNTHVDFTSTATDADGTVEHRAWDLDGDGECDDAVGMTAGRSFASAGTYAIRQCVTDNDGATATRSLSITATPQAPIADFTIDPADPDPGETITLTSTSTDPDDAIASTTWDLDDDGDADDATGTSTTVSFPDAGVQHVHIRVQDAAGHIATRDRAIAVGGAGGGGGAAQIAVTDASVTEGNAGTAYLDFTVSLDAAQPDAVDVDYDVTGGTATEGVDFAPQARTSLHFSPGQAAKHVRVPVYGDTITEPDETVVLTLSDAGNGTIADATGTGTITNDDGLPAVSIANASAAEGSVDHPLTFTVTLAGASASTVTVNYATAAGTASTPGDFATASGTVSLPPFATSASIPITVKGDADYEDNEAFTVTLSAPTGATLGTATATGTIVNDDDPPQASVADAAITEGNSGTTTLNIPVTLSARSKDPVTVHYSTAELTADDPGDYTGVTNGTATISPGSLTGTLPVTVKGDAKYEAPNETLRVSVSGVDGGALGTASATGTITDDDTKASVAAANAAATEDNANKTVMVDVSLDKPAGSDVIVHWQTVAGTATTGSDYTAASGDLTFSDGQSAKQVPVQILGDEISEATEALTVTLSQGNNRAILAATPATVTIADDDPEPQLTVAQGTPTARESGEAASISVSLASRLGQPVTVTATYADHTPVYDDAATPDVDMPRTATTTIAAGGTTGTMSLAAINDALPEATESFDVLITASAGVPVTNPRRRIEIIDNDAPPTVSVGSLGTVTEGTGGTGETRQATVTLSRAVEYPVSFRVLHSADLVDSQTSRVTIPAGQRTASIPVTPRPDQLDEDTEALGYQVTDFEPSGIAPVTGTITVTDDDGAHAAPTELSGAPLSEVVWYRDNLYSNSITFVDSEDFEALPNTEGARFRYHLSVDTTGLGTNFFTGGPETVKYSGDPGAPITFDYWKVPATAATTPDVLVSVRLLRARVTSAVCFLGCEFAVGPEEEVARTVIRIKGQTNAPRIIDPPEIEGSPFLGSTLTCTDGVWHDLYSFTYTWVRGSLQLGTGPTYQPKASDINQIIRCRVTATDGGLSSTATSAAVTVQSSPPQGPYATGPVTVTVPPSGQLTTTPSGTAGLPVTCSSTAPGACAVRASFTRALGGRAATISAARPLASGRATVPAGKTAQLKLRLTKAGRKALRRGHKVRGRFGLTITSGSLTVTSTRPLRLHRRR